MLALHPPESPNARSAHRRETQRPVTPLAARLRVRRTLAGVGGRIVGAVAHPRWRPAYYLDVEVNGKLVPIYFRGDRGEVEQLIYPLEHEARVPVALERYGLQVPHVYGFCEDPRGIVVERVEGRPDLSTADSPEEAQAVLNEFVDRSDVNSRSIVTLPDGQGE